MKTLLSIIVLLATTVRADFVQQQYSFTSLGIQPGQMATGPHNPADTEMLYFNLTTGAATDAGSWFSALQPDDAITVFDGNGFEEFAVTDTGEEFHAATRWGSISVGYAGGSNATAWPFAEGEAVTVFATPEPALLLPLFLAVFAKRVRRVQYPPRSLKV